VTSQIADPHDWAHYALDFELYTHFTSPIRRYADDIVHRLLAYSMEVDAASSGSGSGGAAARAEAKSGKPAKLPPMPDENYFVRMADQVSCVCVCCLCVCVCVCVLCVCPVSSDLHLLNETGYSVTDARPRRSVRAICAIACSSV
jgi:hypothetical protein